MTTRLSELDVIRVDVVDRAAVRDPKDLTQPERFLLWKSEGAQGASMPNPAAAKLAEALSKAADNEASLDEFIGKASDITPELATAIKGAFRLLSTAKATLTPEALIEMAKAMGMELEKAGNPFAKPHAFQAKESPDGTCALDGFGGGHAIHNVGDNGASGSKETEAAEKAEEVETAEPTEEIVKSELAKLPEAVRKSVEQAMELAKAETARADAAEKESLAKAEQIAKDEVRQIVKEEMAFVPSVAEDALVDLLHGLRKSDTASFEALRPVLKSTSEAVAKSKLLQTEGSAQNSTTDNPNATITEIAKGIAKAEEVTFEKAKSLAWERNPELRRQYDAELRARS
jgi:hypothetical protein